MAKTEASNVIQCPSCISDPRVLCPRDVDAACLICGRKFCGGHIGSHLKEDHCVSLEIYPRNHRTFKRSDGRIGCIGSGFSPDPARVVEGKIMAKTGDVIMPWGRYKGQPISEIPTSYLDWLVGDIKDEALKNQVLAHLRTRADWKSMDLDD